jgi:UDP-N-acetylmuramoyl-L-alanyl-D-glutamate--2,6-diaminopimelate ligase
MMAAPVRQEGAALDDLLANTGAVAVPAVPVAGVAMDSRDVRPGSLFLACRGGSRHGLGFAEAAVRAGAAAVAAESDREWPAARLSELSAGLGVPVVEVPELGAKASEIAARFFGRPGDRLRLLGVTGTNGKTTVTQYLARALAADMPCAIVGTLGAGYPDALRPTAHTTPDAVTLQATLADLRAGGARAVAMEVSSHALHQHRVAALRFDTAVFTNLTRDHLDYHQTMEAYAEAKARLFRSPGLRVAVINTDDPFGLALFGESARRLPVVAYGLEGTPAHAERHVAAERLVVDVTGLRLHVRSSWGEGELVSPLLGRFNAANLLAVLAVLLESGVPLDAALARVGALRTVPGRMERLGGGDRPLVVVDYAHTPDALAQVLGALREHCAGRLFCVFGCGGERDRGKRPLMGEVAETLADRVVVTDDNPRHEDGDAIVAEILAGLREPGRAAVERNRARAIALAVGEARPGDIVLVAGKGHEPYQQIGDLRLPFSDREVVLGLLQGPEAAP